MGGRNGVWWDYGMALSAFMSLFLRTFELYGTHASPHQSYVRLRHKWAVKVLDHSDTIMVHLARLKDPKLLRYHKAAQPDHGCSRAQHGRGRRAQFLDRNKAQDPCARSPPSARTKELKRKG